MVQIETTPLEQLSQALGIQNPMMRAAVIVAPQQIEIQQVAIPSLQANEVLVKLEGCGLCGSNLPVWEGREWFEYPRLPGNPGHEGWGRVADLGSDVKSVTLGDRVAFLSERAFAEYDIATEATLVKLPDALADQPFPGEPLACAMNVFARSGVKAGETVAIIGIGFLGALLTQLAAAAGARVITISRRNFALDIAKLCGAEVTIPMLDHWQIIEQIKELTNGEGCDCVIEAVGLQWPLDLAAELTHIRGRLIIAGYHQDGARQVNMQLWNWRGLDVVNAHEREPAVYLAGMQAAVDAVLSQRLKPQMLYTHSLSLAQLDEAFILLQQRPKEFLKALIMME